MDATLEVRWFRKGTPPAAIEDWFSTLTPQENEDSARTDLYLHAPHPHLNVKLREGKVQAKRCLAGGFPMHFVAERVAGRAEPWRKFSFKTKNKHLLDDEDYTTGLWMPVNKARRQRTLSADALTDLAANGQVLEEVEANIELTRVRKDEGPPWWTICIETEGRPDALEAALGPAARHFFAAFPEGHALPPEASMGYVQWLLQDWSPAALTQHDRHTTPDASTD